jgi:hypothetical protein
MILLSFIHWDKNEIPKGLGGNKEEDIEYYVFQEIN